MRFSPAPRPRRLRLQDRFAGPAGNAICRRGLPPDVFDPRPVIGQLGTGPEPAPCTAPPDALPETVRRGACKAGGRPAGGAVSGPPGAAFRTRAARPVEERVCGQPLDGVVALMGCDRTTRPLRPAASEVPAKAMTGRAEAMGMALPGPAPVPAVDPRRRVLAQPSGRRTVPMVRDALRPCHAPTGAGLGPAVHLRAMAGRVGLGLPRGNPGPDAGPARLPGTACGAVVRRTGPEAAPGGPLAVARTGGAFARAAPNRRLQPDIPAAERAARRAAPARPSPALAAGGAMRHRRHVGGADTGAEPVVLRVCRGKAEGGKLH